MKNFENIIKENLENFEAEYNPADWNDLEKKLNAKAKVSKITKGILYSAATIAAAGLVLYFVNNNTEEKNIPKSPSVEKINVSPVKVFVEPQANTNIIEEKSNENKPAAIVAEKEKTIAVEQNHFNKTEIIIPKETSPEKTEKEKIIVKTEPATANKQSTNSTQQPVTGSSNLAPNAIFRSDKNITCAYSPVQFNIDNNEIPCEYRWDFGDGENSSEANPKHIYKNPGTYSVKLQVISLLDKKSDVQVMNNMITVHPSPYADFNWKFASNENPTTMVFESTQDDIIDWKWDFGDRQTSSEQKPSHLYGKRGNYKTILSMKNIFGCTTVCQKEVNVTTDYNLFAPNSFSPNGDGKNDTWLPVALLEGDYQFTITIIDKAGNLAYKTSSKNQPWDGRNIKTNEIVKTGDAFKWMAVVKDKNGIESTYGGVIIVAESSGY